MTTKEQIITNMCYTMRHDYGLRVSKSDSIASGITDCEAVFLYNQMKQVFENCIEPYVTFKE